MKTLLAFIVLLVCTTLVGAQDYVIPTPVDYVTPLVPVAPAVPMVRSYTYSYSAPMVRSYSVRSYVAPMAVRVAVGPTGAQIRHSNKANRHAAKAAYHGLRAAYWASRP